MRAKMDRKRGDGFPALDILARLISLPGSFLSGLVIGLVAPLGALGGIAGGVYLFTQKVPFFRYEPVDPEIGGRSLAFELMSPSEAQEAFGAWRAEVEETWAAVQEIAQAAAQEVDLEP